MTELEVPHAAWSALQYVQYVQDEKDDDAVRAIATPVVVAELRKWADRTPHPWTRRALLKQANKLEAGTR